MFEVQYIRKQSKSFTKGRKSPARVRNIILHSTDGHEAGDVETLTEGKVSVHWYVTKTGKVYHFVEHADTAYHAGVVFKTEFNNANTIGIEHEHMDGEEAWPEKQVKMVAAIVAAIRTKYGHLAVLSHAAIAKPQGRKQDPVEYPWKTLSKYVEEFRLSGVTLTEIK